MAVIKQETNSWKWTLIDAAFLAILTFVVGTIAYHLAVLVI